MAGMNFAIEFWDVIETTFPNLLGFLQLRGFCDHHAVRACVCVSIPIYEPLDRFTKSNVNAVPLENIALLIFYISNNNMAVARACEVEAT
jgi:hypothetical protein